MNVVRDNLMPARRDWNRQGPHVPGWFRRKLRALDPNLALQFMPPSGPGHWGWGVNPRVYPYGAWVVCRQLRRTGLLLKHWTYCLHQPGAKWRPPTNAAIKLIRRARNLARHRRLHVMEESLDRAAARLKQEQGDKSRQRLADQVADTCRKLSISKRSMGLTRVSMHGAATER